MTIDYRPIDCDRHSELERLALRRLAVTVELRSAAGPASVLSGVVHDLRARAGAEYLVVLLPGGDEREIRLDHLRAVRDGEARILWRQENVDF